jgi:hypothetical protein
MTTPRIRAVVSLAATLIATLALGACAAAPSRQGLGAPSPVEEAGPLAIRFDNEAREQVYVYLVGQQREWLLGRVEPGAVATLRIPEESVAGSSGFVQLAVLTGERATMQAARSARARLTVLQSASELVSQRWRFSQGQLMSVGLRGASPVRRW